MKRRSFGHYFTHALFDFFESAHGMHSVMSTFAALTIVIFFFPYMGLVLFGLSILGAIGMATYSAVKLKQKDDKYIRLAKENLEIEQNQRAFHKKQLDFLNSLELLESIQVENEKKKNYVYQQFSLLMQLLDEYLHKSNKSEQQETKIALKNTLGEDWLFVKEAANSEPNDVGDVHRLLQVNQRLVALLKQRLTIQVSSTIQTKKMDPLSINANVTVTDTETSAAKIKPISPTSVTVSLPPLSEKEDISARKRSLWVGVKTAFSVAVLSVVAISVVTTAFLPLALASATVLSLAAIAVTVTALGLAIGTAAAYYDFHIVQPKLREQVQVTQKHQNYRDFRETLSIQDRKDSVPIFHRSNAEVNDNNLSQTTKHSFSRIDQKIAEITAASHNIKDDAAKTSTLAATTQDELHETIVTASGVSYELAPKPGALSTKPEKEANFVAPKPPETTTISVNTQKRWWHYLAAGAFEFINRASSFYVATSITATIIAAIFTTLFAPYITLAALVLTLVGSAGAVGYYTWQQVQKDKALLRLQQEHHEIEARREKWRVQLRHQQHALEQTSKVTNQQELQVSLLTELTLLIHTLEDFLLTLTHDERFHALLELNEILGEDWQSLQGDLPKKFASGTNYVVVAKLNAEIKTYLNSHVDEEVRLRYLSRHPKLSSFLPEETNIKTEVNKEITDNPIIPKPTKAHLSANITSISAVAVPKPQLSRKRALWSGCKTTVSSLALLVAAASITVSIIFPPAILPALVLPLVGAGIGLLAVSVATGIAAAFYDYKVVQPKQQAEKDLQAKHQQYTNIAKKLDELDRKRVQDEKLNEATPAMIAQKQSDIRLEGMKARAVSAVERLSLSFKTMKTELTAHFSSKVKLPEFEQLMKPAPVFVGMMEQESEAKPVPEIRAIAAA